MYHKFVIIGVSFLALMTLVASAQQSGTSSSSQGEQPGSDSMQPLFAPGQALPLTIDGSNFFGSRAHRKEIELAQKSAELVKQLAKAEGEKRDKIKDELTNTLGEQFDARQKRHEAQIKALEDQEKKLKELVRKRQDNRREIISKRLDQLVREAEGLGW